MKPKRGKLKFCIISYFKKCVRELLLVGYGTKEYQARQFTEGAV